MKRNLDLVRRLLLVIESAGRQERIDTHGLSVTDPEVQYHLRLMVDAHLLQCVGVAEDGAVAVRLTWQGHELLELCRNQVIWERAKAFVARRTQGLSATVLQSLLSKWALASTADAEQIRYVEQRPPASPPRPLPRPRVSVGSPNATEKRESHENGHGRRAFHPQPPRAPAYQAEAPSYARTEREVSEPYRETYSETDLSTADWRLKADPWYGKYLDGLPIYLL